MRVAILVLLFISVCTLDADAQRRKRRGKQSLECAYHVEFRDIFTDKPLPGIQLTVDTLRFTSDSTGQIFFTTTSTEYTSKEFSIDSPDNSYESYRYSDYFKRVNNPKIGRIYLTPSIGYDLDEWAKEDSIYGKVKDTITPCGNGNFVDTADSSFVEAEFDGGIEAMQQFISKNVQYPQYSIEQNEQGKVCISFVVEKDGNISHIRLNESVAPLLNKEAIRIVRSMPKWSPGKDENGKIIRVRCKLPIIFQLY